MCVCVCVCVCVCLRKRGDARNGVMRHVLYILCVTERELSLMEVRAPGLCATDDRFVLKNVFADLSISANDCQPLAHDLPCETLLQGEI